MIKTYIITLILFIMALGCTAYKIPNCVSLNGSTHAMITDISEETTERQVTVTCLNDK